MGMRDILMPSVADDQPDVVLGSEYDSFRDIGGLDDIDCEIDIVSQRAGELF